MGGTEKLTQIFDRIGAYKMRKFGEKSETEQTVFVVTHSNITENENGVLGVYNDLEKAESFIRYSEKDDVEMRWNVEYFIAQQDVE